MKNKQGQIIKKALRAIGMSQGELSRRLGVDPSHTSKVIGGTRNFGRRQIASVSDILGIPLAELVK